MSLLTTLMRRTTDADFGSAADTPKHLGWLMLTALGIGATIGAGIFAMPGIIAGKAGPAGILSFVITGIVILIVAICYERFSVKVPHGVSAYSYVYYSIGEVMAWIVAFGLFLEYSFGASAVSIAWGEYLKNATNLKIDPFWCGPVIDHTGQFHFGVNIIAIGVIFLVSTILLLGGVSKSAKLNFFLVILKMTLLVVFLGFGLRHVNPANWFPFMPHGFEGVLKGAATAVFPYVGFDALYTFARESKSLKDTRLATYWCVGIVAFLYISVMAVATGLAPCYIDGKPNELFVGTEAAAPLAKLLASVGEGWTSQFISFGAVLGIFNVLLVFCMGGPRIFKNMAEDGLLPPVFQKTTKGNPVLGIILNGLIVAGIAGFVPFGSIADMMVLGTLVAFVLVCIGALRLKLVHPLLAIAGAVGCSILACNLEPMVLKVYSVTLPVGLLIYFVYGFKHSKLGKARAMRAQEPVETSSH
ncbi:MAG: amino acid permease [Candidatus Melainabacteria bacterium]|jgi:APA family basic amino acid/polyamine antiporter|nr:amino acid permease [Candidatus Melainabacteria bacterium]